MRGVGARPGGVRPGGPLRPVVLPDGGAPPLLAFDGATAAPVSTWTPGLDRPTLTPEAVSDGAPPFSPGVAAPALASYAASWPREIPVCSVSVTQSTGTLANDASTLLNYGSRFLSLRSYLQGNRPYAVTAVAAHWAGTGTGPILLSDFSALGHDLGQEIAVGRGLVYPMCAPLPPGWIGELQVRATNRTQQSLGGFVTIWIGVL